MSVSIYLPVRATFNVAAGNHAQTNRIIYTVPAGHVAELEHVFIRLAETTATLLSQAQIIVLVGGARFLQLDSQNALGDRYQWSSCRVFLNTGDVVQIDTVNASLNTLTFGGGFFVREYQ